MDIEKPKESTDLDFESLSESELWGKIEELKIEIKKIEEIPRDNRTTAENMRIQMLRDLHTKMVDLHNKKYMD